MKMNLKTLVAALTASAAMMTTAVPAQASGVPVIDVAGLSQMMVDYQNQIMQIEQMRQQIKAMTDNGNYAGILKDPTLRNYMNKYLPAGYNDIFDAAVKGDLKALQKVAEQVQKDEALKRSGLSTKAQIATNQMKIQGQMAIGMGEIEAIVRTLDAPNGLIQQLNRTVNPAQKQDLANTIMANTSLLQARIAQMDMMFKQAEMEEKRAKAVLAAENHAKYRQMKKQQQKQIYKDSLFNK